MKELETHMSQGNYAYLEKKDSNGKSLDPNIVANYLKRVLRQMREPLIPERQYDEFSKLDEYPDDESKHARIREIVDGMPLINQRTLKYLVEFFQEVVDYEPANLN